MELTKTLVVGVDGSDSSTAAVRWAADEAVRRGAKLKLVHVWDYSPGYVVPTDDILADAEKALNDAATIATDRGAQVDTLLVGGSPVHTLVRESESAEMLVLGNYGHGRLADIFLGSISRGCIRLATRPIVVIPAAITANTASAPLSATNRSAAFNVAQCGLSID
jgi:nucleotide-binding universal stress UspA family protein